MNGMAQSLLNYQVRIESTSTVLRATVAILYTLGAQKLTMCYILLHFVHEHSYTNFRSPGKRSQNQIEG